MKKKHFLSGIVTLFLVTISAVSCKDNRNTNEEPTTTYEVETHEDYMGTPANDPMYATDTVNGNSDMQTINDATTDRDTVNNRIN